MAISRIPPNARRAKAAKSSPKVARRSASATSDIVAKLAKALMRPAKHPKIQLAEDLEAVARTLRKEAGAQIGKRGGRPRTRLDDWRLAELVCRARAKDGKITAAHVAEWLALQEVKKAKGRTSPARLKQLKHTYENRISAAGAARRKSQ